jgi:L-alanine-DL-glutamate epimerase-like enolase superfamily enzyme
MIITSVEPIVLRIPFTDGSSGVGLFPAAWTHLDIVLVRIATDAGLVGWGEGFGYFCATSVAAMVSGALAPLLTGREVGDPGALNEELQRRMVLPGRYGISIFALSGVDIALWDLRAKAQGVAACELLGKRLRRSVPAYASLVRYGEADGVARRAEQALTEGFRDLKLHEITMPEIRRCRAVVGNEVPIAVDVNCNWSEAFTREATPELIAMKTRWLEEPVFPPEDFRLLASLRTPMLPIAAGENACTAMQFAEMIRHGAIDYLQPSVTKVGGISECEKIRALNRSSGLPVAPHSPYFGPGYLATLQLAAVDERFAIFEYLYIQPDDRLYRGFPLPERGKVPIPEGPGLGLEPDPEIIARYRVE